MRLDVIVQDQVFGVEVPDELVTEAEEFFRRMDADMDRGWQVGREWVERPDTTVRCQIAADRLLTALHTGNEAMKVMMAAYILARMPGVRAVEVDTEGNPLETALITA